MGLTWVLLAGVLFGAQVEAEQAETGSIAPRDILFRFFPASQAELYALDRESAGFGGAAQFLSAGGREDLTLAINPGTYSGVECPAGLLLDGDPLELLAERSRSAQIIMINEAHDQPLHRHFVHQLGLRLADQGVSIFAAETFNHEVTSNMSGGHVPEWVGGYTVDPVFGRELIALHEAGYEFIAYEDPDMGARNDWPRIDRINAREEVQAENFIARALGDDPGARALVHVGHGHLNKRPLRHSDGETRWFGARLWDKTGIEPLTIDQTRCASPGDEVRLYSNLGREIGNGGVDFYVAHPEITFTDGRPDWRRAVGDVDVPVPEAFLGADVPVQIEARAPDAPLDTLAIERLWLYPGETLPLLLPPGEWRLDAFTAEGRLGEPVTVRVAAE